MRASLASTCLLLGALAWAAPARRARPQEREATPGALAEAPAFFAEHCVKCHGPAKQKAGLRLDRLVFDPSGEDALASWLEVRARLASGEMPPEEEPRPDPARVAALVAAIDEGLAASAATRPPAPLRRLNRVQYRNTLRDLLAIDVRIEDPTASFPLDDAVEGFDNLGEGLVMSDYLMRQLLTAARAAVDLAIFEGPRPTPTTRGMADPRDPDDTGFRINHTEPGPGGTFLFMNDERSPGDPRGQVLTSAGAPERGWYEYTFEVESRGRGPLPEALAHPPTRAEWQVYRPEDLHRLEIYLSAPAQETNLKVRPRVPVDALDLPDGERVSLRRRYWLPRGWRLELAFGNAWAGHAATYLEGVGGESVATVALQERFERIARETHELVERADAPRIVIHAATEHGPVHDCWPPASHVAIFGDGSCSLEDSVRAFATRAFRRPVADEVLAPFVALARASPEGLRTAIEAILCSPRFVYLIEEQGALDGHALASRLSYFLWSTMPDERLLAAAASDELHSPGVLRAEVERMLADARSDEFVQHFLWGWLGLQNTLEMPPDSMRFQEFHRSRIDVAMLEETRLFFRHLLDENRSVLELIDADFTFVNADLARHYGLASVPTTAAFQRVALAPDARRGGVLGQASVLTASANGVDSSPVVRGIWVLERLLASPPRPPPAGVVAPDPDTTGDFTVRELLAKHRSDESCDECHSSIDPLGFALENFDAVGRWRDSYESGARIDASGQMPGGEAFEDVRGMKRSLLADPAPFARALTEKLLTYAAGRTMGVSDDPEIERIAAELAARGYGLRDLVLLVCESPAFTAR